MENGNNNSNSGNNNNGATPDEIANAVFSFSESAIKLKDAGILFDETIALVNKVAQTALKKLEEKIIKADWSSNNNSNNNGGNNSQPVSTTPDPVQPMMAQQVQPMMAPTASPG